MFLGLFQYTIDTVVKDVSKSANLSLDAVQELELNVVPIRQASNVTGFLFTSVFIYFFSQHQIVGITNAAFDSIQLDEYATISE
uniref:Uncharacterized protein n=1 Tax=Porcine epidemic diarrhea virus TaxID=28295 RepID=A0A0S3MR03_PEDV|nr:hypothetical protein [Porcine epidemic diarrhea virus]